MNVHVIQHVPFEGLGSLESILSSRKARVSVSRMFEKSPVPFPADGSPDLLVVLGGPMGVADTDVYPWLAGEIDYIAKTLDRGRTRVLGICLGAQLASVALGAAVRKNPVREIGWFPVRRSAELGTPWVSAFPDTFTPFHWHGDTFDLPSGAIPVGSSEACENQGYVWKDRLLSLQFHLEMNRQSLSTLIEYGGEKLDSDALLGNPRLFGDSNELMDKAVSILMS